MSCCVSGARAPGAAPRHVRRQRARRAPARKRSRPRGQPDAPWRGRNRAPQLRAASRLARQRARRKAPRRAGGAEGRWHMSDSVRIALAQLNLLVGDVQGNAARVIAATRHAHLTLGADLVLFPELTLSGYPPEDLLFHRGFRRQIEEGLARVRRELTDADGAQLLLVINASPYEIHKQREREDMARERARDVGLPLAYVNLVGGQDELVFDGNSFFM